MEQSQSSLLSRSPKVYLFKESRKKREGDKMKYYKIRGFDSDIHVLEYDPRKNVSQVSLGDAGRQPLSNIHHGWLDRHGYKEKAKINLGFFDTSSMQDIHYGVLWFDSGFVNGHPNGKAMECYLTKDKGFVVEELDKEKAEQIKSDVHWGGSLSYALVIDGKKNLKKSENFPHWRYKHPRTLIGQKKDGTMVLVVADGRSSTNKGLTGPESADVMLSLGVHNAINADGGGSSTMSVSGKIVNNPSDGQERSIGSALIVYDDPGSPEEKEEPKVTEKKICIDPGHGGSDPGASGHGLIEKDLTLEASLYQKKRFEDHGIQVIMTRTTDKSLDPEPRTDIVKLSGADLCLSNHFNAYNGQVEGAETIFSVYSKGVLAGKILDAIVKEGIPKRRSFSKKNNSGNDWYYMHRLTGKVETIIIEYDFIDNAAGSARIKDKKIQLFEAVVKTVVEEYFGMTYQPVKEPEEKLQLYRVIVDKKQIAAYGDINNILLMTETYIKSGAKEIKIEKV
jgi:N-acetylmuramoyl-L-alanine amidase